MTGYPDNTHAARGVIKRAMPPEPPKPKSRVLVLMLALAVIVVVVGLLVWQWASPSKPASSPSSALPTTGTPAAVVKPVISWVQSLGGEDLDIFRAVAVADDDSIVAVGYTLSTTGDFGSTSGAGNAVVAMFDAQGNRQWCRTISDQETSDFNSVAIGADGSIYAVGSAVLQGADPKVAENRFALVAKLTMAGEVVWQKTFGGNGYDELANVVDNGNGLIAVGDTSSTNGDAPATHGDLDALVVSLTYSGDISWAKTYGGSQEDYFYSATIGANGQIAVVGASGSHDGDFADPRGSLNAVIAGISPQGDLEWSKVFGGSELDLFNTIRTAPDGSYLVAGVTWSLDGDLPNSNSKPSSASVYGQCIQDGASCQWTGGPAGSFYGGDVTTNGLYVVVGSDIDAGGCIMGVINLATGETQGGLVTPDGFTSGSYSAIAALPDNRVVAVGYASKSPGTDIDQSEYDAIVVVIGFE